MLADRGALHRTAALNSGTQGLSHRAVRCSGRRLSA
jgi:hypothetical protein